MFFGDVGKRLDQKPKLISKFIAPSTGQQMITILTMPNISRSYVNQITKFGQLMEYNMRNISCKNESGN